MEQSSTRQREKRGDILSAKRLAVVALGVYSGVAGAACAVPNFRLPEAIEIPKVPRANPEEARSLQPVGTLPVHQYSQSAEKGAAPGITGLFDRGTGRLNVQYGPAAGVWAAIGIPYKVQQFPSRFVFGSDGSGSRAIDVKYMGEVFAKWLIEGEGDFVLEGLDSLQIDELAFSINSGNVATGSDGKLAAGAFGLYLPLE